MPVARCPMSVVLWLMSLVLCPLLCCPANSFLPQVERNLFYVVAMINNIGPKRKRISGLGQQMESGRGLALKRLPEAFLCWFMQLISGVRRIDAEMEAPLQMTNDPSASHIVPVPCISIYKYICIWLSPVVMINDKGGNRTIKSQRRRNPFLLYWLNPSKELSPCGFLLGLRLGVLYSRFLIK